jgi:hypothetical protein
VASIRLAGAHGAHKTGRAPFIGYGRKLVQQDQVVALIPAEGGVRGLGRQGPHIAVPGGMYSRRAAQGVHFNAGIVGHRDASGVPGHGAGLEERIFLKTCACLFHIFHPGKGLQADHFETKPAQAVGQVADFSGIAGRKNNFRRAHDVFPENFISAVSYAIAQESSSEMTP